jgi:p21-activated kinase 1
MDHDVHNTTSSNLTTFTSSKRRRNTLTKNPPPSAYPSKGSLRKQQSAAALQRAPSAPSPYQRSNEASQSTREFRQRSQSNAYGSSTSSLEHGSNAPSPIGPSTNFFASTANGYQVPQHLPLTPQTSDDRHNDLIGAPFDASGLLSSFQAASMNEKHSTEGSSPQPNPLTHTQTSPDLRSHPLRTSQTFGPGVVAMMEVTPPKSENGTLSPKRFSGDGQGKPAGPFRKKSGFSSFVNNMLGSPRTIKISAPENPMHMIHVGYDNQTGQFTVSRAQMWQNSA